MGEKYERLFLSIFHKNLRLLGCGLKEAFTSDSFSAMTLIKQQFSIDPRILRKNRKAYFTYFFAAILVLDMTKYA